MLQDLNRVGLQQQVGQSDLVELALTQAGVIFMPRFSHAQQRIPAVLLMLSLSVERILSI